MAQAVRNVPVRGEQPGLTRLSTKLWTIFYIRRAHLATRADPRRAQVSLAVMVILMAVQCTLTSVQALLRVTPRRRPT